MTDKSNKTQSKILKVLIGILVAIVAFVVLVVIIGVTSGGDEADTSTVSAESATETTTEEETITAAPEETTQEPEGQAMPWTRHERCEPDDGTAAMLTGVLNDQSITIANAQLIRDGEDTWIGASLIDAAGEVESRSDVWLLQDGALFSVSGGAKNESWAVEHPDAAYNMTSEFAQGVDRCVVAESTGR